MIINDINSSPSPGSRTPFWVLWTLELWERFGYYGLQAILAIYFAKKLWYNEFVPCI